MVPTLPQTLGIFLQGEAHFKRQDPWLGVVVRAYNLSDTGD